MARPQSTLDVISNLALAGAAAAILVRPGFALRVARSPVLPKSRQVVRHAAERLRPTGYALRMLNEVSKWPTISPHTLHFPGRENSSSSSSAFGKELH